MPVYLDVVTFIESETDIHVSVITGLVDTGPGRQQGPLSASRRGARKLSMYERAKQLSLPTSFVGLRHDVSRLSACFMSPAYQCLLLSGM